MRIEYTFIGALLIITGVILILFGYAMIKNVEINAVNQTPTGEFLKMTTYQMGQIIEISGVVVFIIGLFLLIISIFKPVKKSNEQPKTIQVPRRESVMYLSEDPRNILDTRYAKGEISKEQYDQMKKDLEK